MSTTNPENTDQSPQETPEQTGEPASTPDAAEATSEGQEDTFSRSYVEELRAESARHRIGAKRADELARRLVSSYVEATGRLHDPRDLAFSDDLMGEDGFPDPEKVTSAVEALIKDRPHLARIRLVGDVGQGVTNEGASTGLAAFGDMLRSAAS